MTKSAQDLVRPTSRVAVIERMARAILLGTAACATILLPWVAAICVLGYLGGADYEVRFGNGFRLVRLAGRARAIDGPLLLCKVL